LNHQLVAGNTTAGDNNSPMFLLANLAVGGSWPGNPTSSTPFPSYMLIDYIKAYSVGDLLIHKNNKVTCYRLFLKKLIN